MKNYQNMKDLGQEMYREVIRPSVIGSLIAFDALVCTQTALNNASFNTEYRILWPTHSEQYIGSSEKTIDKDGNGIPDTKITVVPRAGILEKRLNE